MKWPSERRNTAGFSFWNRVEVEEWTIGGEISTFIFGLSQSCRQTFIYRRQKSPVACIKEEPCTVLRHYHSNMVVPRRFINWKNRNRNRNLNRQALCSEYIGASTQVQTSNNNVQLVPLGVNIFLCSKFTGLAGFGECAGDAPTAEQASSFISRISWACFELEYKTKTGGYTAILTG